MMVTPSPTITLLPSYTWSSRVQEVRVHMAPMLTLWPRLELRGTPTGRLCELETMLCSPMNTASPTRTGW